MTTTSEREESTSQRNHLSRSSMANMPTYDLVCIGFGPAQIATAIANREARKPSKVLFLERKPCFSWHSSHLTRTRMENSFVYDLATMRNPRSAFSYTNYLLVRDRLVEFANSDKLEPLRMEFDDYLNWCAEHFKDDVRYSSEVVGVAPEEQVEGEDGETISERNTRGVVNWWSVAVRDTEGKTNIVRARAVAAPSPSESGREKSSTQPHHQLTSIDFSAGQRIVAMADYIENRNALRARRETPLHIAVVGSGTQAIEIVDDLLSCPQLGNITVVTENEAFAPLRMLSDTAREEPPPLCALWARPACEEKGSIARSSALVQSIYNRAYEKRVASKGSQSLRIVMGKAVSEPCATADIIIAERPEVLEGRTPAIFHGIDGLVLGCRQKGESLEEVQFKRGTVAKGCSMWMLAAHSAGGRSLAKDIALRAGEVVNALALDHETQARQAGPLLTARI
jgi:L-ornithine N5-monooxygenase